MKKKRYGPEGIYGRYRVYLSPVTKQKTEMVRYMKRDSPNMPTKTIKGRRYYSPPWSVYNKRESALRESKELRKIGYNARVVSLWPGKVKRR